MGEGVGQGLGQDQQCVGRTPEGETQSGGLGVQKTGVIELKSSEGALQPSGERLLSHTAAHAVREAAGGIQETESVMKIPH